MPHAVEWPIELSAAQCPAYILCGGQSARFGADKARVRIDRQPHLLRLADELRSQGHETRFVADREDRYRDLGIAAILDAAPECGPLAGLVSAIEHRATHGGAGWLLLISCDQLQWLAKYFRCLAGRARDARWAITFCDPLLQPIPGLYHTRIHAAAHAALTRRQLSLKKLLESLAPLVAAVEEDENPRDWCFNSVAELQQLLHKLSLKYED
jgi:molybdopterin-guanine dinucleotide biosynthesis protein A